MERCMSQQKLTNEATDDKTIYSRTSLNQSTIGLTLNGRFRELEYHHIGIVLTIIRDPNKAIDIGEWSICGVISVV